MTFDGSATWFKFTKSNRAGYAVEVVGESLVMLPATPLQYLNRWRVHNFIFRDRVKLVGVSSYDGSPHIVVAQGDLSGEAPSWESIEATFTGLLGLRRLDVGSYLGGYESRAYFNDRIAVFDVRPLNCVQSASGAVVPFDVIPQFFGKENAAVLNRLAK